MNAPAHDSDSPQPLSPRREAHVGAIADLRRREQRLSLLGLAILFLAFVFVVLASDARIPVPWWVALAISVASLAIFIRVRERAAEKRADREKALQFVQELEHRRQDHFAFGQSDGSAYLDPRHPFAGDLDVFGKNSIFFRLNATRTPIGRDQLANWLLAPIDAGQSERRREAVQAIEQNLDFFERHDVLLRRFGERGAQHPAKRAILEENTRKLLRSFTQDIPDAPKRSDSIRDFSAALLFFAVLVCVFIGILPALALLPVYLLNFVLIGRQDHIEENLTHFESVQETLEPWGAILQNLEESPIEAAMFKDIRERLANPVRASSALRHLERLVTRLSQHHNEAWTLTFGVATLLDAHVSRSLIRWRRQHAHLLVTWLQAAGEAEALLSLACYSEGYRSGCFGSLEPGRTSVEALDLGHPLVSANSRRGNDLLVPHTATTLLFTGSNMSGKSTFLRSVGLAIILTNLGVRIPAKSFRAPPLLVITCMRIADNLSDGSSLFFAEVSRLKQCVEAAKAQPASLILLDEILAGTNSRERHEGTRSVLHLLAGTPATVLIATHDLALADLPSPQAHPTRLLHFRETIDATGRMTFDYRLREGPCPTTNALEILRQAGLYTDATERLAP